MVRKRAARMGRDPMTGEAIKIKARKKRAGFPRRQGPEDGDLNRLSVQFCKTPPLAGGVFIWRDPPASRWNWNLAFNVADDA